MDSDIDGFDTDRYAEFSIPESAKTWITVVDTRSGIREDKLILDIAALEEGSRYARLQFLNPDGKVLKSIDIWQSTDFTIKFELISLDEREIRVKSIPTDPDVWYHMGIASAEDFDRYADWHKFVENLISSDGGGLLAVYVGDEEFSTTCTPGTEYVIYGFAYDDSEVRSDISIFRVSSVSLPRNYDVDVSATWAIYNGKALAELYPSVYGEYGDATCVFVFTLTPSNAESVHYWGLLHAARSETMSLPDMLIFDYLESYPSLGWLDSKRGVYRIPEQNIAGPWGFFYVAQDESGAWGELHYEEVLLTEDKYEDPRTAPMDGFDNKKTWAVKSAASVAFPAPIRFSKASFMQVTESFGGF